MLASSFNKFLWCWEDEYSRSRFHICKPSYLNPQKAKAMCYHYIRKHNRGEAGVRENESEAAMEEASIIELTFAWYQASLIAWLFCTLDSPRGYRHIYISGLAFQTEGKSIYLPLLSRGKGLPNTGKIPLNFQVVHMCYWASPMSSHASTSAGNTEFCVDLYIPFGWSGAPAPSQLVLCEILCTWRGVSDASVERGVLPLHLLLRHIVFLRGSHCLVLHVAYQKDIYDNTRIISVCTHMCVHVDFQKFTQMVIYKNRKEPCFFSP